jgi:hypothetical protein
MQAAMPLEIASFHPVMYPEILPQQQSSQESYVSEIRISGTEFFKHAVIALNEKFHIHERGDRDILDFADAVGVSNLALKNSSFSFLQPSDKAQPEIIAERMKHVAYSRYIHSRTSMPHVSYVFESRIELANMLKKQRKERHNASTSSFPQRYSITCDSDLTTIGKRLARQLRKTLPQRYSINRDSDLTKIGKGLARQLRKTFPLDRFIITESTNPSGLEVLQCLPQGQNICSADVDLVKTDNYGSTQIGPAAVYFVVSSLPLTMRLDILHSVDSGLGPAYPDDVQNAARLSIMYEVEVQVRNLTRRSRWHHTLFSFRSEKLMTSSTLGLQTDTISSILRHPLMKPACGIVAESLAYELLSSTVMSARCQNNGQLLQKLLWPFKRTRSHVKRGLFIRAQELLVLENEPTSPEVKSRMKAFKKQVQQKALHKSHFAHIENEVRKQTDGQVTRLRDSSTTTDDIFTKSIFIPRDELERQRKTHKKVRYTQYDDQRHVQGNKEILGLTRTDLPPIGEEVGAQEMAVTLPALQPANSISNELDALFGLHEVPATVSLSGAQNTHGRVELSDEPLIELEPDPAPAESRRGHPTGMISGAELHGNHTIEMNSEGVVAELQDGPLGGFGYDRFADLLVELEADDPPIPELPAMEVAAHELSAIVPAELSSITIGHESTAQEMPGGEEQGQQPTLEGCIVFLVAMHTLCNRLSPR